MIIDQEEISRFQTEFRRLMYREILETPVKIQFILIDLIISIYFFS